jgi:hypothetical protein
MVALMRGRRRRFSAPARTHRTSCGIEALVREDLARIVVWMAGTYLTLGLLFAVPFVLRGVQRIDPVARDGTWGFRLLIVPGVTLLWPLLARRWAVGSVHPPTEVNAHRRRAGGAGRQS